MPGNACDPTFVGNAVIVSLGSSKALARRLFPRAYETVQVHKMGRELATEGSVWAQNALSDAVLSAVIRRSLSLTSTAIDIGAAHGRFAREMAHVARRGSVLAIEPVPTLNAQLKRIFRSKGHVSVLPYAVGQENKQTDFWICDSNVGLSGLAATHAARQSGTVQAITVPVRTLDSITAGFASIDLIKIDVEGGEYDVLCGAEDTLSTHHPIIAFECTSHADEYENSPNDVFELLARQDYEVFPPTGYLRGTQPLSQEYFLESINGGHEIFFFAQHPSEPSGRSTR